MNLGLGLILNYILICRKRDQFDVKHRLCLILDWTGMFLKPTSKTPIKESEHSFKEEDQYG